MEESQNPSVLVEICTGPNCSAGGAAILEIEELILENGTGKFEIVKGGCRDLCSMGPNVHCQSTHFPRIKSPEDCHEFAVQVGIETPLSTDKSGDSLEASLTVVGSMMIKKANRLRWKVLRDVGSRTCMHTKTKVGRNKIEEWRRQLVESHRMEVSAVRSLGGASDATQRATRRLKRLEQLISSHVGDPNTMIAREIA